MSKIRINELARQLEVKSREVIDKLHELGITEALTHSSSIDDDNAEKLRRYFGGDTSVIAARQQQRKEEARQTERDEPHKTEPVRKAEPAVEHEAAQRAADTQTRDTQKRSVAGASSAPLTPEGKPTPPAAAPPEATKEEAHAEDNKPRAIPLRPPHAGTRSADPSSGRTTLGVARFASAGLRIRPASAGAAIGPLRPIPPPARPIPSTAPRPGQILSGPRQPLPCTAAASRRQPRAAAPSAPQSVRPGVPIAPPPRPAAGPGQPQARCAYSCRDPQPGSRLPNTREFRRRRPFRQEVLRAPSIVGQPTARPVVPPRADLAARLQPRPPQPYASPSPAMPGPAAPRPGVPLRSAPPRPGQPLYQGPPRPGQPSGPRALCPARHARPRSASWWPASRCIPLRVELCWVPVLRRRPTTPRRAALRRISVRRSPRDRRRDAEEKILRPQMRSEQAVQPPPINRDITISEGITVKELSEKLDVRANLVIKKLVDRGIFATINQTLDVQTGH